MSAAAVVVAWLLRHEVVVGWAAAVGGAVALMVGLYVFGHHAGVAAEKPKLEAARQVAAVATAQTGVVATAARAADASAVRTIRITAKAEEAVHDIQAAPGATDALDPDLLARWRTGLVACAQRPLVLTVPVALSLRSPCPHVSGENLVRTSGDLAAYSLRQEAALSVCDARREAILAAVDAHNAAAEGLRGGAGASHSP